MKAYAQKQCQPQQQTSPSTTGSRVKPLVASHAVDSILYLQRTIGNQAVQRLLRASTEALEVGSDTSDTNRFAHDSSRTAAFSKSPASLQTKLTINEPGDISEQEADRVSEQMTSVSGPQLQRDCACGGGCPTCQNEQTAHEHLQTKHVQANDSTKIEPPTIVHKAINSSGQPLDSNTREVMESRLGHDFTRVRIHADSPANQSSRALHARAFTYGRDIFFRQGQYDPGSLDGKRLLAHELTHTLQQDGNPASHQIQRQPEEGDDPRWLQKGMKPLTAQADKTATPGYMPHIGKGSFSIPKKAATTQEKLDLLDRFLAFLRELDKKVESMKGDATQKAGSQVYGPQSSSQHSPGSKPAKDFVDLGSVDFEELMEYLDLIQFAIGPRGEFTTPKDLKDPVKLIEFIHDTYEKIEDIEEALKEEEKRAKSSTSPDKEQQSPAKKGKATKINDGTGKEVSVKYPVEFTIPKQGGEPESPIYWQFYIKAKDGSGLFLVEQQDIRFNKYEISTYGDQLYSLGGRADQIFDHYPKGYTYTYVGDPELMHLLPNH